MANVDVPASAPPTFKRRDALLAIEGTINELWSQRRPFETEAPSQWTSNADKFYVTFPFPYMNGRLHLGHAFSLTKSEFSARFQRLTGKCVLWPFAFHCTGMPIAACADKLRHELEDAQFGERVHEVDEDTEPTESALVSNAIFTSKKSKQAAKSEAKTQKSILLSLGIPEAEIPNFADPKHWLKFFPPIARSDLERFGLSVDWRRAFITTEENPYFDRFVQWQYRTLFNRLKIKFGLRPAIFSRTENQPCADHDRATGEGANPQEYTLIKLKLQDVPKDWIKRCPQLEEANVYLVAATLRPETMYAQTNCFVLPEGEYTLTPAFSRQLDMKEFAADEKSYVACKRMTADEVKDTIKDYFICSSRAALNMGYQGIVPLSGTTEVPHSLFVVLGQELIGLPLEAPLAVHKLVHVLPLLSIKMDKGTGVVTSVPSDAPDDYAMLMDLQKKEKLRNELGVELSWCQKDIVQVIEVPGYGRQSAVDLCIARKVDSWKDEAKLKEIKQEIYQKSFYEGVMLLGEFAGKPVREAKDLVRARLIETGEGVGYFEPERKVMSRSDDECIVALCHQWYSDFGDSEWKEAVMKHVENPQSFEAYGQRAAYIDTVNWLDGWACSRNYGLGTLLPWEAERGNRVLIESLSDSTIYFAYYTVSHFLQGDMYGKTKGSMGIGPEDLTDEVFDYVFCQTNEADLPLKNSNISQAHLQSMRSAFSYWYPMTLRCSGKDLVRNHLTMSLFHHAAMWPNRPDLWPRGFFVNGHLMLDSEKMSKSTGNFLTLRDAIDNYGADATRLGLADAGDSVDDANFERQTANSCLMRLYVAVQACEEVMRKVDAGVLRTGQKNLFDRMFENELINLAAKTRDAYESMCMRDALKYGFYEFLSLRDAYRLMLPPTEELHQASTLMWIEWASLLMSPIACFTAEYVWSVLLKKDTLIAHEKWPVANQPFDAEMHRMCLLLNDVINDARRQLDKLTAKKKDCAKEMKIAVFVAKHYQPWQQTVLRLLQTVELDRESNVPKDPKYIEIIKSSKELQEELSDTKAFKMSLAFASYQMKEQVRLLGPAALNLEMSFDELAFLNNCEEVITRQLGVDKVEFVAAEENADHAADPTGTRRSTAVPGKPAVVYWTGGDF